MYKETVSVLVSRIAFTDFGLCGGEMCSVHCTKRTLIKKFLN